MGSTSPFSTREQLILEMAAQGLGNKEIAGPLFISEQTVKNHLHNMFDKLRATTRLLLVVRGLLIGLLDTALTTETFERLKSFTAGFTPLPIQKLILLELVVGRPAQDILRILQLAREDFDTNFQVLTEGLGVHGCSVRDDSDRIRLLISGILGGFISKEDLLTALQDVAGQEDEVLMLRFQLSVAASKEKALAEALMRRDLRIDELEALLRDRESAAASS